MVAVSPPSALMVLAGDRQRGGRDDEERDQRQDAAGDAVHLLVAGVE